MTFIVITDTVITDTLIPEHLDCIDDRLLPRKAVRRSKEAEAGSPKRSSRIKPPWMKPSQPAVLFHTAAAARSSGPLSRYSHRRDLATQDLVRISRSRDPNLVRILRSESRPDLAAPVSEGPCSLEPHGPGLHRTAFRCGRSKAVGAAATGAGMPDSTLVRSRREIAPVEHSARRKTDGSERNRR
jgi:hypothetical protein